MRRTVVSPTFPSNSEQDIVGLGVCVVTNSALAAGGAALPGPIADIGSDIWLWWAGIPLDALLETVGQHNSITSNFRGEIDSKGMRKLPNDSSVVLMGELSVGNMPVDFFGSIQFLLGS